MTQKEKRERGSNCGGMTSVRQKDRPEKREVERHFGSRTERQRPKDRETEIEIKVERGKLTLLCKHYVVDNITLSKGQWR